MNKTPHYKRIEQFMKLAKQETPAVATLPSEDIRRLRAKLIFEEAMETIKALGFEITLRTGLLQTAISDPADLSFHQMHTPDIIEIIDGCCDISVVTIGALIACGVPDQPFLEAVDTNNLAKFGPGHTIREDGKLVKPPGHKPPDIAGILLLSLNKHEESPRPSDLEDEVSR